MFWSKLIAVSEKRSSWLDVLKGTLLWDFLWPLLGVSPISIFVRSMTGRGTITNDVEIQKSYWIWKFVYWNLLLLYLSNHRLKKIIHLKKKKKKQPKIKALASVPIACVRVLLQPICTGNSLNYSLFPSL